VFWEQVERGKLRLTRQVALDKLACHLAPKPSSNHLTSQPKKKLCSPHQIGSAGGVVRFSPLGRVCRGKT